MGELALPIGLGAATEARIAVAFSAAALITADAAAGLLGLDVKTLRALSDELIIRAVRVGKVRRYTEADIRSYLIEGPSGECRSTSRPRAASSNTTSSFRGRGFTDRPARLRVVPPKPSSGKSA